MAQGLGLCLGGLGLRGSGAQVLGGVRAEGFVAFLGSGVKDLGSQGAENMQ